MAIMFEYCLHVFLLNFFIYMVYDLNLLFVLVCLLFFGDKDSLFNSLDYSEILSVGQARL